MHLAYQVMSFFNLASTVNICWFASIFTSKARQITALGFIDCCVLKKTPGVLLALFLPDGRPPQSKKSKSDHSKGSQPGVEDGPGRDSGAPPFEPARILRTKKKFKAKSSYKNRSLPVLLYLFMCHWNQKYKFSHFLTRK